MTRRWPLAAVLALSGSVAAHLVGVAAWPIERIQIEGGTLSSAAQLGNAFQDIASGVQRPVETEEVTEASEIEEAIDPLDPEQTLDEVEPQDVVEEVAPQDIAEAVTPEDVIETVQPDDVIMPEREGDAAEAVDPQETQPLSAERLVTAPVRASEQPSQEVQATISARQPHAQPLQKPQTSATVLAPRQPTAQVALPSTAPTVAPHGAAQAAPRVLEPLRSPATRVTPVKTPQPPRAREVVRAEPVRPLRPIAPTPQAQPTVEAPAPTTLMALPDDTAGLQLSSRPVVRPDSIAARARPVPQQQPRRETQAPQQSPNRGQNAPNQVAGQTDGQRQAAQAERSTRPGNATQAGTAAATNYPGQVARKIARIRRPRTSASGTAIVAFTIADNGRLSALSLRQSSGDTRFDQAVLQMVRRAAPFPRPPAGARRSYTQVFNSR